MQIVWRGGATTGLTVMMPVNALHALPRYAEMEERILTLARIGLYDDEIAHADGRRTPLTWTRDGGSTEGTVRDIRLQHGIKVQPRQTRCVPAAQL